MRLFPRLLGVHRVSPVTSFSLYGQICALGETRLGLRPVLLFVGVLEQEKSVFVIHGLVSCRCMGTFEGKCITYDVYFC